MRETLYEHGTRWVAIRVGFDAFVRFEWPNTADEPLDLTARLPELLKLGWKAPPLPPVTAVGPDGERTALAEMTLSLGEDGSVTVYENPTRFRGLGSPGDRLTQSEVLDVALRGLRVVLLRFAADLDTTDPSDPQQPDGAPVEEVPDPAAEGGEDE